MRKLLFTLLTILSLGASATASAPKYEMRAVWITTNWGLDWPSHTATTPQQAARQQAELCDILDHVAQLNFNTVFFQVRTKGEVFYTSYVEPWSPILSGESGLWPGYDPLQYAIEECHKRGLECHAWIITIPAGSDKQVAQQGEQSLPARQPHLCVKIGSEWYLNPGHPETAEYLATIAEEIAYEYPIDGIHLDYIRYPAEQGPFPDEDTYAQYASPQQSLEEWRTDNITNIVHAISGAVKSVDEAIMVSSAPLGRYTAIAGLPYTDWTCTASGRQDAIQWMHDGENDFVAPMMYYKGENFNPYLQDWIDRTGTQGLVVAGIGIYRIDPKEGAWTLAEIEEQIAITRQYHAGQALFRYGYLSSHPQLGQMLSTRYYTHPALVPPMTRVNAPQIMAVQDLSLQGNTLTWQHNDQAVRYVIYASETTHLDTDNPQYILHPWVTHSSITIDTTRYKTIAITAIDAFRRESTPTYITLP